MAHVLLGQDPFKDIPLIGFCAGLAPLAGDKCVQDHSDRCYMAWILSRKATQAEVGALNKLTQSIAPNFVPTIMVSVAHSLTNFTGRILMIVRSDERSSFKALPSKSFESRAEFDQHVDSYTNMKDVLEYGAGYEMPPGKELKIDAFQVEVSRSMGPRLLSCLVSFTYLYIL